jgi:hypothetical protein
MSDQADHRTDGGLPNKIERLVYEPIRRFASITDEFDELFSEFGATLRSNRVSRARRLVSISPPRSMTSFLFHSLKDHDGVHAPINKETNYYWTGWRFGEELDREGVAELNVLDLSPSYAVLPTRAIRKIAAVYPDLSILLMLRDPVARTLSHIAFEMTRPGGAGFGLDELSAWPDEAWLTTAASLAQLYSPVRILDRWLSSYSPESINVCFCEGLVSGDPKDYAALSRFLGVEHLHLDFSEKVASLDYSKAVIPKGVYAFLTDLYAADLDLLRQRLSQIWSRTIPECWSGGNTITGASVIHRSSITGSSVLYANGEFEVVGPKGERRWVGSNAISALGIAMGEGTSDISDERALEIHFALANGRPHGHPDSGSKGVILIKERYFGWNIVFFDNRFFGARISAGHFDLRVMPPEEFGLLQERGDLLCFENLSEALDALVPLTSRLSPAQIATTYLDSTSNARREIK